MKTIQILPRILMLCSHNYKASRTVKAFIFSICIIFVFGSSESAGMSELSKHDIPAIYDQSWQLLSRIHIDRTVIDKAIALYEEVLKVAPRDRDIHWKFSEVIFKKAEILGDDEKSLVMYKKALGYAKAARELYPKSIGARFWVGCCSARIAEILNGIRSLPMLNQAKTELKLTIELEPDHRFAILARAILAAIYTETPWPLRDIEEAERFAREAVEKDPNLTLARVTLAKVFLHQKKYTHARNQAVKCLNIDEPTYVWDAELYNWPDARRILKEIDQNE
jgi:tetratricopeptide (TPR) repeat protein